MFLSCFYSQSERPKFDRLKPPPTNGRTSVRVIHRKLQLVSYSADIVVLLYRVSYRRMHLKFPTNA